MVLFVLKAPNLIHWWTIILLTKLNKEPPQITVPVA
jgi:hypothetical protein